MNCPVQDRENAEVLLEYCARKLPSSSIAEFDRYQGRGVPDGRVSLSLRLTFRAPERTLTDDEAQDAMERIVESLRAAHGAERR